MLQKLRESFGSAREWDPTGHGLDAEELTKTLTKIIEPAVDEHKALRAEHDLGVSAVLSPGSDPVLAALNEIIGDRVGKAYSSQELRDVVAHAVDYRYPNEMPPGYLDDGKSTDVRKAGDYILWRQLLDEFSSTTRTDRQQVLLVTGDTKADWWHLDKNERPISPRLELIQEFEFETGHQITILTTDAFLEGARTHLHNAVSDDTLVEAAASLADNDVDEQMGLEVLLGFTPEEERIARDLMRLGYGMERLSYEANRPAATFLVTRLSGFRALCAVPTPAWIGSTAQVRGLIHLKNELGVGAAYFVTSRPQRASTVGALRRAGFQLLGHEELLQWIAQMDEADGLNGPTRDS